MSNKEQRSTDNYGYRLHIPKMSGICGSIDGRECIYIDKEGRCSIYDVGLVYADGTSRFKRCEECINDNGYQR